MHTATAVSQVPAALSAIYVMAGHRALHFFFQLGLLGLFFIAIVDSSFIPLPIPGVTDIMVILYAANHTSVFLLILIATSGSALGGLFSHAIGQAGGLAFLEKNVSPRLLKKVTEWMNAHALISVALPAILPPPAPLSPFVLVAGAANMSRKKFMFAFVGSRLLRHCIAAWLGVHYGKAVLQLWAHFSARWGVVLLVVFWTITLVFTGVAIWKLYKTSREMKLRPAGLVRGRVRTPSATRPVA